MWHLGGAGTDWVAERVGLDSLSCLCGPSCVERLGAVGIRLAGPSAWKLVSSHIPLSLHGCLEKLYQVAQEELGEQRVLGAPILISETSPEATRESPRLS